MKRGNIKIQVSMFLGILLIHGICFGAGDEFAGYEAGFKNFITCELTRTDAVNHFNGSPFKITMINLHNIAPESGLAILTGAVQCFVKDKYITLYPALGVRTIADKKQVSFYTIRKENFSILATQLMKYPYKERCPWTRYWVDLD